MPHICKTSVQEKQMTLNQKGINQMPYYINDDCIGCTYCWNECPTLAISFDGDKYAIDPEKCIKCDTCIKACLMGAIRDTDTQEPESVPHEPIRKSCDFLVVGGGAAGLVAATRFAELTGKKAIVLEKNRKPGGGGWFAVGYTPSNTRWEKEAGMPDTLDDNVRNAMDRTNWSLDIKLVKNLFKALGEAFDWLCEWSDTGSCFHLGKNPFNDQLSVTIRHESNGSGRFITSRIVPRLNELGVEILTDTAAREVITTDDGTVTGVIAADAGGEVVIECKACLLATGSLIRSPLTYKLYPKFAETEAKRYAHSMPGLTGDALMMAEKAGIPLDYDSICLAFVGCMPVAFDKGPFQQGERGDAMKVNLNGERWCNEMCNNQVLAEWLLDQPKSIAFTVMDSSILQSEMSRPGGHMIPGQSGPSGDSPMYPYGVADFAMPRGDQPTPNEPGAMKALAEKLNSPTLCCGNTLEELANKMGVPADKFVAAVERYNKMCLEGRDADFLKKPEYMKPLVQAPFFAMQNYLYLDGIFGGLNINDKMEVVSKNGPVKGLYAAGDITSGRYTNDNLHKTEIINDYSWAIAGGFMAGTNSAEKLGTAE